MARLCFMVSEVIGGELALPDDPTQQPGLGPGQAYLCQEIAQAEREKVRMVRFLTTSGTNFEDKRPVACCTITRKTPFAWRSSGRSRVR